MIESTQRRLLLSIFFFIAFIIFSSSHKEKSNLRRNLLQEINSRSLEVQNKKPIIYTFYHNIDGSDGGGTGMNSEADRILLKIWRDEWITAGWIPRVLTMEDARQNPYFKTLDRMLDGLPFKMYDRLCFLRWLAMSNQPNGGFLADYDTFPLAWASDTLPYGGRLTVYEYSPDGGVPSLISAKQSEWARFAWALVENAVIHKHEKHWSDMKAMQNIYQQSGEEAFVIVDGVIPGTEILHGRGYPEDTCHRAYKSLAVHFSHYSVDKGILPDGISPGPQARAPVAEEWLKGWRKNCATQSIEETVVLQAKMAPMEQTESINSVTTEFEIKPALSPRGLRPIIFAFYDQINDPVQEDLQLIDAWARSWFEIGWEPRILDQSVARQHPEIGTFEGFLEPLLMTKEERLGFYRYLSMGMAGGGWMSDYNVYPLKSANWEGTGDPMFLPNEGRFTVYESSEKGVTPSLMSGSMHEWFRLAKSLVDNAVLHNAEQHWSDTMAMRELNKQSGEKFVVAMQTVFSGYVLFEQDNQNDACTLLQGKLAIHFSPSSSMTGIGEGRAASRRQWISNYRSICAEYEKGS